MAIQTSVSLYSLQDQFASGQMSLEDMFAFLQDLGSGLELISDQMLPGTPRPPEAALQQWDLLRERYPIALVCNDIFINTCLYRNRTLTTREATRLLIDEIQLAHRLGFPLVRLVSATPTEIIEPALPYAEKYGVKVALEIHAGTADFNGPLTKKFLEIVHRTQSPYLGIVVDCGIFCRRHPRIASDYFLGQGASPEVIRYIDGIFAAGSDPHQIFTAHGGMPEELTRLFRSEKDLEYCLFAEGYENLPLSVLDEHLPYLFHIHGKTWEVLENGEEYSIPYMEIISYLHDHGYTGYISTEYEGTRFTPLSQQVPDLEQVALHQAALKRMVAQVEKGVSSHV